MEKPVLLYQINKYGKIYSVMGPLSLSSDFGNLHEFVDSFIDSVSENRAEPASDKFKCEMRQGVHMYELYVSRSA